jgi:CheY-like chemotaxis protein
MSRILVTDDDPVQLGLRKTLLEAAGHEVAAASDPSATIRELERQRPDLLIMDLRLTNVAGEPDSHEGLSLIRRVRQVDGAVPVLVLSGWPEELYGAPEEEMVSRVMVKPVACRELLEVIEQLV